MRQSVALNKASFPPSYPSLLIQEINPYFILPNPPSNCPCGRKIQYLLIMQSLILHIAFHCKKMSNGNNIFGKYNSVELLTALKILCDVKIRIYSIFCFFFSY